ncbi:hypothetical protein ACFFP9_23020 [Rhizobium paknamense]
MRLYAREQLLGHVTLVLQVDARCLDGIVVIVAVIDDGWIEVRIPNEVAAAALHQSQPAGRKIMRLCLSRYNDILQNRNRIAAEQKVSFLFQADRAAMHRKLSTVHEDQRRHYSAVRFIKRTKDAVTL